MTGVSHKTVINCVKDAGNSLSIEPDSYEITEIAQIDELHTYVGKNKQNMAVDSGK